MSQVIDPNLDIRPPVTGAEQSQAAEAQDTASVDALINPGTQDSDTQVLDELAEVSPSAPTTKATGEEATQSTSIDKPRWSLKTRVGAGVAAVAAVTSLGAGAFIAGRQSNTAKKTQAAPVAAAKPLNNPATTPSSTSTTVEAVTPSHTFNVSEILPTDTVITVTRINGDQIRIPMPRDPDVVGPAKAAEAWLDILAGYLTTGDSRLSMPVNPGLDGLRDKYAGPYLANTAAFKNFQIAIYGGKENPPTFTMKNTGSEGRYIELTGGDLFLRPYIDNLHGQNAWQEAATTGPPKNQMDIIKRITQFKVRWDNVGGNVVTSRAVIATVQEPNK